MTRGKSIAVCPGEATRPRPPKPAAMDPGKSQAVCPGESAERARAPEAPGHLSERSRRLWREVVPRRASSPERLAMLQAALEALDRSELARLAVERDGMTTTTKTTGAVHLHPLLKVEKESRQQFLMAWDSLGLNWCGDIDGETKLPGIDRADMGADLEKLLANMPDSGAELEKLLANMPALKVEDIPELKLEDMPALDVGELPQIKAADTELPKLADVKIPKLKRPRRSKPAGH